MTSCSAASAAAGESLAGTAPWARAWLAVEQPGPWGRDALRSDRLPAGLADLLRRHAATDGLQVVLIRRAGPHADVPGPRTVLAAGLGPAGPWLQRTVAGAPEQLTALLGSPEFSPAALVAGLPPGWPDAPPTALVCGHARRDRCCAIGGRALAVDLIGLLPVWESSHLGGHRFAPTLALLPSGLLLGRADRDAVLASLAGRPPAARMRGFSRLHPVEQAAEVAARLDGAAAGPEPLPVAATAAGYRVTAVDGEDWLVAVTPETTSRQLSCAAEPEPRTELRTKVLERP